MSAAEGAHAKAPVDRVLVASRNEGKLRELRTLLAPSGLVLETLRGHPEVPEVEETGDSFEANASLKASAAARASGLWTLGEDSGIAVDALGGEPGVRSARYAGSHGDDAANNARLLRELADTPPGRRTARYVCALVLARPDGEVVAVAQGTCEGSIAMEPRGTNGFGYDPIFITEGKRVTNGELDPAEKDAVSHRAAAVRTLLPLLAVHGLGKRSVGS